MLTLRDITNEPSCNKTDWFSSAFTEQAKNIRSELIIASDAISMSISNFLCPYQIKKVIFHDPATIVIWKDKTKTVVKCHDEPFDREKGLAMCIAKKVLGKDFHKTFREWCE